MRHMDTGGVFVAALLLGVVACSDGSSETGSPDRDRVAQEFVTRPDLTPPKIDVTTTAAGKAANVESDDAFVFLGVKQKEKGAPMNGPLIVDSEGDPVWIKPMGETRWTYDLRVQQYRDKPVLTYWRGDTHEFGYGEGELVLLDQSYREIATVTTPGTHADFHEGNLTDKGTALLLSYPKVPRDLTSIGGSEDGWMRDCVVHEVDVATGKELFRWSALDHIPITDTEKGIDDDEDESGTQDAPFDPYHCNSINTDGNSLLVSARHTHAVYRINRRSGEIVWTLGGKSSDFNLPDEAQFHWQHDAQRQDDRTITLFDNEASEPSEEGESRGLRLSVDPKTKSVDVVTEYLPPDGRLSESQANVQVLDNGRVFIGWGSNPNYSLYSADGELLQDAELAGGISYRAYRQPWVGNPIEPPKLTIKDGKAYVSWNGATEVEEWRFVAGYDKASAEEVETVPADGFESSAKMPDAAYVAAIALDEAGTVLGTAEPGAWPVK